MKKMMIVLALFSALVGCGDSPEKTADKMNDEGEAAQVLVKQGTVEYLEGIYYAPGSMSIDELEATRAKLLSSKANLVAGRAKYQKVLDLHKDNKESIKLINKQSIVDEISAIDQIVADIDLRVSKIEALLTKKAKAAAKKSAA